MGLITLIFNLSVNLKFALKVGGRKKLAFLLKERSYTENVPDLGNLRHFSLINSFFGFCSLLEPVF